MRVKKITLSSFRNIDYAEIPFKEGMNFLLGGNAQGKTNILEGIYLFARGKSFRLSKDAELIKFGAGGFSAELVFEGKEREERLAYRFDGKTREKRKNGVLLERTADMLGHFRAVLFYPDHLQLVKGSPSERRRFLDVAISQCYPVYLSLYTRYAKYLSERNSLLKLAQKGNGGYDFEAQIAVYSDLLASLAAELRLYREEYAKKLSVYAKDLLYTLSGEKESLSLTYHSDTPYEEGLDKAALTERYKTALSSSLPREIGAGSTLFGVHRDDLVFYLNGKDARDFASQGQQRSLVLVLKLAEGKISEALFGDTPVYLFDDVLSELDEERKKFLLEGVGSAQFIFTGCDRASVKDAPVHFIEVENGEVTF
ncbi:MAG: DNA replication/repair protein RecF [Clostridia bacterium]|nr:DNA replication/repair protein RecF [Clostridia bacterium]